MDFDSVEEVLVTALHGALKRWPHDYTRAAADFRQAACAVLREILAEDMATEHARGVASAIAYIVDLHPNRPFVADCIAFAAGLHALQAGLSESEIATRHGVKRATVSKWVQIVRRDLSLPPPRGGRDEEAIACYATRAHRVHGTEPTKVQTSGIKIETAESLIGRLLRWVGTVDVSALSDPSRIQFCRALAGLRESLVALQVSLPPPR